MTQEMQEKLKEVEEVAKVIYAMVDRVKDGTTSGSTETNKQTDRKSLGDQWRETTGKDKVAEVPDGDIDLSDIPF